MGKRRSSITGNKIPNPKKKRPIGANSVTSITHDKVVLTDSNGILHVHDLNKLKASTLHRETDAPFQQIGEDASLTLLVPPEYCVEDVTYGKSLGVVILFDGGSKVGIYIEGSESWNTYSVSGKIKKLLAVNVGVFGVKENGDICKIELDESSQCSKNSQEEQFILKYAFCHDDIIYSVLEDGRELCLLASSLDGKSKKFNLDVPTNSTFSFSNFQDNLAILSDEKELYNFNRLGKNVKRVTLKMNEKITAFKFIQKNLIAAVTAEGMLKIHNVRFNSPSFSKKFDGKIDQLLSNSSVYLTQIADTFRVHEAGGDENLASVLKRQDFELNVTPLLKLSRLFHQRKSISTELTAKTVEVDTALKAKDLKRLESIMKNSDVSEFQLVDALKFVLCTASKEDFLEYSTDLNLSDAIMMWAEKLISHADYLNENLLRQAITQKFRKMDEIEILLVVLQKMIRNEAVIKPTISWLSCTIDAHFFSLKNTNNEATKTLIDSIQSSIRTSQAVIGLGDVVKLCDIDNKAFAHAGSVRSGYVVERLTF